MVGSPGARVVAGFSGDGGPAVAAQLSAPADVVVDGQGNLFIADSSNRRIRKVTPEGTISTAAGDGSTDPGNDGGPATAAGIDWPRALAVDAAGNLFVADTGRHQVHEVTSQGTIQTVAGNGMWGFSGDGGSARMALLDSPEGVAVDAAGNLFIADTLNGRIRKVAGEPLLVDVPGDGALSLESLELEFSGSTEVGYGRFDSIGGTLPAAFEVVRLRQNGVLVSEATLPSSTPLQRGRFYAETQDSLSTGVAMVNPNEQSASIAFVFTGTDGSLENGTMTIPPGTQIAAFLHQSPFGGPDSFKGSFTFDSSVPIAVAAIRGRLNERNEWLMTALPVDDLSAPPASGIVFPQFAEGAGWKTEIVLVNRTARTATGTVAFRSPSGESSIVNVGNANGESFGYAIPPGGAQTLETSGSGTTLQNGTVYVFPDPDTTAPSGLVILSFRADGVTVTEFGAPAVAPDISSRLFVQEEGDFGSKGSTHTALAIASVFDAATVTMELHQADGSPAGLAGTLDLPAKGQAALFLNQIPGLTSLPANFEGVLDVSATAPIVVIAFRTRRNARGDFIATVVPSATGSMSPASTLYFPQIVNSGDYTTEFILLGGSRDAVSGELKFSSSSGEVWSLPIVVPN
jgi:hypothetical protein